MFFKQFYDQPLAQASYLIGCQATGDAIVVDPLRDIQPYLDVAAREGLRIAHVTETHIHADFVSGARELAAATGARLSLSAEGGPDWQYAFAQADGATLLHDGDVIMVGNIRLDVLHTPGHTPEHLSFVVTDQPAAAGAMGIITGDFVFVGDVGRPDLLEKAAKVVGTMEAGARTLFHSLERFRALPDHLQVWPGHGAGSACGKALGAVPSSTVGYEKRANWGVATTDEAEFVRMVLEGQPEPPAYFAQMKRLNREGPRVLGGISVPARGEAAALEPLVRERAWIVDLRSADAFARGHVPDTLSIPYNRSFATWAGWLLPYDADVWLLTDASTADGSTPDVIQHAVRDLALIGLDRVAGWFDASAFEAWQARGLEWRDVPQVSARELAELRIRQDVQVLDVRGAAEWEAGHLPDTQNIPVGLLADAAASLDPLRPIVLQCQSGARSMIASSVLLRAGRLDIQNLTGGFVAWRDAGLPVDRTPRALA
jgi:hydroxyacylglutathione hydrolase